ncbi:MAG: M20/M25/M40 family metallo-hydrolase, partial [Clostridiales bacterium]|nr:M20/M25/M40 family metallo-hydrolase [Clostridiales bacterium]
DGVNIKVERNEEAHYISPEDELVQKLLASYRKYTGDMSDPIVLGGGTYAKVLERGVAFGALFPDSDDTMHQKDENILVEDLMLSIAIFAEGIYNLCCK